MTESCARQYCGDSSCTDAVYLCSIAVAYKVASPPAAAAAEPETPALAAECHEREVDVEREDERRPARHAGHRAKRKMLHIAERIGKSARHKPVRHAQTPGADAQHRGGAEADTAAACEAGHDDVVRGNAPCLPSKAALQQQALGRSPPVTPTGGEPASTGNRRVPSRLQPWSCQACTLENPGRLTKCEACEAPKLCSALAEPGTLPMTSSPQPGVPSMRGNMLVLTTACADVYDWMKCSSGI